MPLSSRFLTDSSAIICRSFPCTDCRIRLIGKPLFHTRMETNWGMWLKDSSPHEQLGEKFWLTKHIDGKTLYFYNSLENVKRDEPDGSYELNELYFGTDNVVYNGSFYYHRLGHNEIIKFDLVRNETVAKLAIPAAAFQASDNFYIMLFIIADANLPVRAEYNRRTDIAVYV